MVHAPNDMKLLTWKPVAGGPSHVILLFGLGLIGQSVEQALRKFRSMEALHLPCDWTDADVRARHLSAIETAVADHDARGFGQIDIVWLGGRSGFGTSEDDMAQEYDIVADILALSERLCTIAPKACHGFHLLSSAGGLFEGCRHCTADTAPRPLRPYGTGKMAQEALLNTLPDTVLRRIYRPSSVYGHVPNGRIGLITALIENGVKSKPTHIFGRVDTLRDYVFSSDIGAFIAAQIIGPSATPAQVFLLATGQAVSMHEVIRLVERKLGSALYLQFDPRPSNARDITFMQSALPPLWQPTSLTAGMARSSINYMVTEL